MRILHCLRAPVGGLFRHVLDLAEEQADRGHEVGIIADSTAEDRLTPIKFAAIEPKLKLGIARIPINRQPGIGDVAGAMAVRKHASKLSLDVLHGHGAKGGTYARLAAATLRNSGRRVKVFYTPHGGSLNFKPGTREQRALMLVERGLDSITTGLIFESAFASGVYSSLVGANGAPRRVVPNGVKDADFALADPKADATDLLFVGELRSIKGVDLLLQAIANLQNQKRITATIVGAGPDAASLKAMASKLGLGRMVTFTGALPIREALRAGRVMVVPSLAESFPYVVLEATAAGIPLISTNVGGIPEIVAGTDTQLIAPGSVEALMSAISSTLADEAAAKDKAARLRANVQAKFTVSAMTDAILDFYAHPQSSTAAVPGWHGKLATQRA